MSFTAKSKCYIHFKLSSHSFIQTYAHLKWSLHSGCQTPSQTHSDCKFRLFHLLLMVFFFCGILDVSHAPGVTNVLLIKSTFNLQSLHGTLTLKHASRAALMSSPNHSLCKCMHSESRKYCCYHISLALSPARRFRSILTTAVFHLRSLYFGFRK